jgi:hypothetical protein
LAFSFHIGELGGLLGHLKAQTDILLVWRQLLPAHVSQQKIGRDAISKDR